jgi:hypothetical protein
MLCPKGPNYGRRDETVKANILVHEAGIFGSACNRHGLAAIEVSCAGMEPPSLWTRRGSEYISNQIKDGLFKPLCVV